MGLLDDIKITMLYRGSTGIAATDIDSTVKVDMKGYEGCLLLTGITETTAGATTTAVILAPRYCDDSTGTLIEFGSSAHAGDATITTGDWGQALVVDVYRPLKRYLSASINKTGNGTSTTSAIFAIQYGGKKKPITQDSDYVEEAVTSVGYTT